MEPGHEAVLKRFQELLEERDSLTAATIERQQELAEHDLVIKTLQPADGARKCFRLVGDVLTEQTVADVLPAVQKNRDNLQAVAQSFETRLAEKQKEVLAFQQKYNIRIKGQQQEKASGAAPSAQGVLVSSGDRS